MLYYINYRKKSNSILKIPKIKKFKNPNLTKLNINNKKTKQSNEIVILQLSSKSQHVPQN